MSTSQLTKLCWLLFWLFCCAASNAVTIDIGASQITPAPVLQARGAFQTAGFISGNPNSPITCPGSSSVVKGPEYAFGCCDDVTCWKPATCQTKGAPTCGPNCVYSQITTCTDEASPACAEYILKTNAQDTTPITSFLCLPTSTHIIVLIDATSPLSTTTATTSGTNSGGSTTAGPAPTNTSDSSSDSSSGGGGGFTEDQKIALGCGIGIPLAALIVAILAWLCPCSPVGRQARQHRRSTANSGYPMNDYTQ